MFNYQNKLYDRLLDAWERNNISLASVHRKVSEFTEHTQAYVNVTSENLKAGVHKYVQDSPILQEAYADWSRYYREAYDWIHPRFTELSNTTLHYGSGVSVGILASVIILVIILSRFLPARLKNIVYLLFVFGTSTTLFMFSSIQKMFTEHMTETFIENWQYFVGYFVIVGVISFAVVYRYGPIEDERTLSLIQWLMQFVGLVLVYNSTQLREVSCALVILLLTVYNFPKIAIRNQRFKNIWYRFFPPKIKLLTEDEYIRQADVETKRELEKLRDYCRSPDCQSWRIISRLKNPQRFAQFIEGDSWHVTNDELLDYDSGPDPIAPHLVSDDDEDNESEMDFQLASP